MKIHLLNPLALLGAKLGYNRPLDRHDWDGKGGHVPGWAGSYMPGVGEVRRFANLTGMNATVAGADTNTFGLVQKHPLGTMAVSKDGRVFRYGSAGGADLVAGNIVQSAAPIAAHLALTAAIQAIGDGVNGKPIVVTPGATAGAANLYADGTLMVDTAPGNGLTYRISGHPAIVASTAFNLLLDPDDTIVVALTASSRYGLHHNPYKTVIQTPTTATGFVCGGVCAPITANTAADNFGWLQTRGPFAALINGTPAVGTGLVTGATTAGSLDVAAVAAEINVRIIARAMQVGVSTKNNAVFLLLD